MLACNYIKGGMGLQKDCVKAVELLKRAIELGSIRAHNSLGCLYYDGDDVPMDKKKAKYHFELAAIGGSEESRYHLGRLEIEFGTMKRAVRHWMLGAENGDNDCMKAIKLGFFQKHCNMITKEQYERAIRAHGECLDKMRSEARDKSAKIADRLWEGYERGDLNCIEDVADVLGNHR